MQLFDLFDVQQKGFIDFGDFVRSLNVFHPNAPQEVKIECKCPGCNIIYHILHMCHSIWWLDLFY